MYRPLAYSFPLSVLLVLSPPMFLSAQQAPLVHAPFIEAARDIKLTPQQNEMLSAIKQTPTSQDVKVIRVNAEVLKDSDEVYVPLRSYSISIQNNSREIRGGKVVYWSGMAPQEVKGSTSIVVNGENVTASIHSADGLYRIRPLGDGLHVLFKVDTGKLPTEHPPSSN